MFAECETGESVPASQLSSVVLPGSASADSEMAVEPDEAFARVAHAYEKWEAGTEGENFETFTPEFLRSAERCAKPPPPEMSLFFGLNWSDNNDLAAAAPHYVRALRAPGAEHWDEYEDWESDARMWLKQPLRSILELPDAEADAMMKTLLEKQLARCEAARAAAAARRNVPRYRPAPVPVCTAALFLQIEHAASPQVMQAALFFADALCMRNFGCCLFRERPRVRGDAVIFEEAVDVVSDAASESLAEFPRIYQQLLTVPVEYLAPLGDAVTHVVQQEPVWLTSVAGQMVTERRMHHYFAVRGGMQAFWEMDERLQPAISEWR